MKTDLFYWLLNANIYGVLIGLVLIIVRKIKMPRRVVCALWLLPFLRLWLPFGFTSRFSVFNLVSKYAVKTVTVQTSYHSVRFFSYANCIQKADSYFPVTYKTNVLERVFETAALIWLIGFCTIVLTGTLLYIFTMTEIKNARHLRDNIYVSDRVTSPALYGIFKPRIIIPEYLKNADLTYIILHENAHARRKDNFFRCVALFTCTLHWYNPLVWLLLKKYLSDIELACDESVIAKADKNTRKEYALSLFSALEAQSAFISAFGGAKIRVRINNILSYRALSVFSTIIMLAFIAAAAFALLTNAAA
ncbi:MAG: M56 family metallopeptidase [Clostridia bacterium]|nr:M56 family metallopeptidase [Clostridia bacterium]